MYGKYPKYQISLHIIGRVSITQRSQQTGNE